MMRELAPLLRRLVLLLGAIHGLSAIEFLFSCGFETDLCGMTQRTDDHFDWTRHSGGTNSGGTGPSSAYNGTFYIYIESTEAPSGAEAVVETGTLQHSGTACVTFAYHMYGIGVGELAVRSKPDETPNWLAFSDQGNHWRLGTTEVDLRPGDRVSFSVVRSSDYRGDVALDDIVIRTGGCRTTESLPFSCSFEEGFCGMLQSNDDHFDWTRFDRPTGMGPQQAADGTGFIYIEADFLRVNGEVARIDTPAIAFTGPICVRFKYHVNVDNAGTLYVEVVHGGRGRTIFSVGGNQGSEWQAAEINVTEIYSGDWLRFSGQRGQETRDIGVDGIFISQDRCNDCQMKNGGCAHTCTGSGTCSCRQGYRLEGTHTCVDVNECSESTDECSDDCRNTVGSYLCTCPDGMSLGEDEFSCTATPDCSGSYGVDCSRPCHCADQAPCDPVTGACPDERCSPGWSGAACEETTTDCSGSYGVDCSRPCHCAGQAPCDPETGACPDGRCSPGWRGAACDQDCVEAYNQIVDADQGFESSCESETLLYSTPRDPCLREACRRGVEVVAIRNEVCDIKRCQDSNVQPVGSLSSVGWDIFVLNLTWSESVDDQPSADQGHSDFPLWQVIVAVMVVVLAVIAFAVGIAVYLKRRKMASQATEPDRVYYENDAALPARPTGDVTKPADEAPYEDIDGPRLATASAVQIQMAPPRSDPEDPNPGGYEDLESYEPHVGGPYDVIM